MERHPVVIADASGMIRHWSAGAELEFGYQATEAIGQKLELIVPPEYREAHGAGFRRAIESGHAAVEGTTQTFPVRSAGGEIVTFQALVTLLRDSKRQVIGVMAIFDPRS